MRVEAFLSHEAEIRLDVEMLEATLKKRLERKTAKCKELNHKVVELEGSLRELYTELQSALELSARLDDECFKMRQEYEKTKTDERNIDKLRHALEMELARVHELDEIVVQLRADSDSHRERYIKAESRVSMLLQELSEVKTVGVRSRDEVVRLVSRVAKLEDERSMLQLKVSETKKTIALLNAKVIELQGNIRVVCRVRPITPAEMKAHGVTKAQVAELCKFPDENIVEFNSMTYEFDKVFSNSSTQEDVFSEGVFLLL
jgi:chromosome segregation ATPase